MIAEAVLKLGGDPHLTAIVTRASASTTADAHRPPAFIFLNAGVIHRMGPNRLHVTLARELAEAGFSSIRFDVSGLGDSGPRSDGLMYAESRILETRTVMDHAERTGLADRFVLFGLCSGADHAFHVAVADDRVVGLAMLDGYAYPTPGFHAHRYWRSMLRWQSWWGLLTGRHPVWHRLRGPAGPEADRATGDADEGFVMYTPPREEAERGLASFVRDGGHVLALYTAGVEDELNHAGQFGAMFPKLRQDPRISVEYWPDVSHTFTLLAHQERLSRTLRDWATRCWDPCATTTRSDDPTISEDEDIGARPRALASPRS